MSWEDYARAVVRVHTPDGTVHVRHASSGECTGPYPRTGAGMVVGSAKMGPSRAGPGAHVGTASFMVDPASRGRGVGRALAEDVVAWHRRAGFHAITFNAVVETNTAAVALWQDLASRSSGPFLRPSRIRVMAWSACM